MTCTYTLPVIVMLAWASSLTLDNPSAYKFAINHTDITVGPGPVNFQMNGTDSTLRGTAGKGSLDSCSAMFVPFSAQ
jgi:hypothetical protein